MRRATQRAAWMCAFHMTLRNDYWPATILNIGVGSAPEYNVWNWLYKDSEIVGVDVRRSRWWPREYHKTLLGSEEGESPFCWGCLGTRCLKPGEHQDKIKTVPCTTIDKIAEGKPSPFFIWMDIEGSEIEALKGASKTLEQTEWMNIEVRDWADRSAVELDAFVRSLGYWKVMKHDTEDILYKKL